MRKKPEPLLFLNDARGVYIPRDFAQSFVDRNKSVQGVSDEEWAILEAGPEHEQYWDVWNDIETTAKVTDYINGVEYTLYQDGDLWLIPVGMSFDEAEGFFKWLEAQ